MDLEGVPASVGVATFNRSLIVSLVEIGLPFLIGDGFLSLEGVEAIDSGVAGVASIVDSRKTCFHLASNRLQISTMPMLECFLIPRTVLLILDATRRSGVILLFSMNSSI